MRFGQAREGEIRPRKERASAGKLGADQCARLGKAVDHSRAHTGRIHEPLFRPDFAILKGGQHLLASLGETQFRDAAKAKAPARLLRLEHEPRAHHHLQHHALQRERVVRDPVREGEVDGRQRRHVQLLDHRLQLFRIDRLAAAFRFAPDHADALHRAERHDHEIARAKRFALRRLVGVWLMKRQRKKHGHRDGHAARKRSFGDIILKKGQFRRRHCATLADAPGECNALVRRREPCAVCCQGLKRPRLRRLSPIRRRA